MRYQRRPNCPSFNIRTCQGCQKSIEFVRVVSFGWKNKKGELNPHWSLINDRGQAGYYYENMDGTCYLREGSGALHYNMRDGTFVCAKPGGKYEARVVENYRHAPVHVGNEFVVVNGERRYYKKAVATYVNAHYQHYMQHKLARAQRALERELALMRLESRPDWLPHPLPEVDEGVAF